MNVQICMLVGTPLHLIIVQRDCGASVRRHVFRHANPLSYAE